MKLLLAALMVSPNPLSDIGISPFQTSRKRRTIRPPVRSRGRRFMRAAFLLRRARRAGSEEKLTEQARDFALSLPVPVRLQVCVSLDGTLAYIYAWINYQMLNGYRARSAQ